MADKARSGGVKDVKTADHKIEGIGRKIRLYPNFNENGEIDTYKESMCYIAEG